VGPNGQLNLKQVFDLHAHRTGSPFGVSLRPK
jgi:hypothetical protein